MMGILTNEIRKLATPYIIGLPVIMIALLIMQASRVEPFDLLWRELIIVFGYIAAVIDIRTKKIPNKLLITMLAAWIFTITPMMIFDMEQAVSRISDSVFGFVLGGGIFMLVYIISKKGLGGGDVKFMAVAGLYLGVGGVLPSIFLGTLLAALIGIILIAAKKIKRKDPIPLAPFLFAGMLLTIFLS